MTSAAGKAHGAGLLPEQPRDGAVDDPVDADAPTRTGTHAPEAPAQLDSPANHVGQIAPARLPAPLQYRDPARYDILGEHGRGGLGRVFRARDREMGRDVAVKELLNRGASSELRFFREALITARLEHPGIVPVHEAGRWPDGTPFYAMKLVAGRPLKVLFENARTVEARLALLPHILAVADAIAYAHDRKIIHRDLKPANVIVGEFGETVVIDWGLAKDISPEAEDDEPSEAGPYRTAAPTPGVTVAGSVLGTPAYMAPEQARGELVDERADVYAIGAMLFQVCTGEKTPPTDVYKLHHSLGKSGVDVDLVSIVRKACAPEAGGRYRDAGKLAADLRSFTAGARVLARHYSAGALVSHWVKRHKRLAAAVAVMVVTLGVVGGVAFARVKEERDRAEKALIASREAGVREEEARKSAETERDAARAAQVRELLVRDPTKALPIAEQLPKTNDNVALIAKAQAQPVATHLVDLRPYGIQDAVLSHDQRRVGIVTGDNRLLSVALETGTPYEEDSELAEPTPLLATPQGWTYVKRSGRVTNLVHGPNKVQWTGPQITEVLADGEELYVVANGALYTPTDPSRSLATGITAAISSIGRGIVYCTGDDSLHTLHGAKAHRLGRCRARHSSQLASSGTEIGTVVDTGALLQTPSATIELHRPSRSIGLALGRNVVAGIDVTGRAWLQTSGSTIRDINGDNAFATSVAASNDRVAFGYADGTALVYDVALGLRWKLTARPDRVVRMFIVAQSVVTLTQWEMRVWTLDDAVPHQVAELPCVPFHFRVDEIQRRAGFDCPSGLVGEVNLDTYEVVSRHRHATLAFGVVWWQGELCSGGWDGRVYCADRPPIYEGGAPVREVVARGDMLVATYEDGATVLARRELTAPATIARESASVHRADVNEIGDIATASGRTLTRYSSRGDRTGRAVADGAVTELVSAARGFLAATKNGTVYRWDSPDVIRQVAAVPGRLIASLVPLSEEEWGATLDRRLLWLRTRHQDETLVWPQDIGNVTLASSNRLLVTSGQEVYIVAMGSGNVVAVTIGNVTPVIATQCAERLCIIGSDGELFLFDVDARNNGRKHKQ